MGSVMRRGHERCLIHICNASISSGYHFADNYAIIALTRATKRKSQRMLSAWAIPPSSYSPRSSHSVYCSAGGLPLSPVSPASPADLPRVVRWCVALASSVDACTVSNGRASFSISRVLPRTVPFASFSPSWFFLRDASQHRFSRPQIIFVRLIMCTRSLSLV